MNEKYLKYDTGYSDTQTVKDENINGYSDTQTILDNDLISRSELKTKLEFGICHYCEHYNNGKYDNDCGICKVSKVFQIVGLMEEMKGSTEE